LEGSGVEISNLTTSWRDGLAFCALVQACQPGLVDLARLDPRDWRANCALAFGLAEAELGIPALLEPEDVACSPVPDRYCSRQKITV
jgi:hypothetical protein